MNENAKRQTDPERPETSGRIDFEEIRKVIALLEEKNLSAFELEVEGFKLKINRGAAAPAPAPAAQLEMANPPVMTTEGLKVPPAPVIDADKSLQIIASPMVGTFYRAPDPTSAPFVDIGDTVKKGQTLCIIEAMKLMNEIESDVDGTVVEIFIENAKPVEYNQKLFAIKPLS
jgi:acetyl-CoA carboxylase biotin carboxyl carrier protein